MVLNEGLYGRLRRMLSADDGSSDGECWCVLDGEWRLLGGCPLASEGAWRFIVRSSKASSAARISSSLRSSSSPSSAEPVSPSTTAALAARQAPKPSVTITSATIITTVATATLDVGVNSVKSCHLARFS